MWSDTGKRIAFRHSFASSTLHQTLCSKRYGLFAAGQSRFAVFETELWLYRADLSTISAVATFARSRSSLEESLNFRFYRRSLTFWGRSAFKCSKTFRAPQTAVYRLPIGEDYWRFKFHQHLKFIRSVRMFGKEATSRRESQKFEVKTDSDQAYQAVYSTEFSCIGR